MLAELAKIRAGESDRAKVRGLVASFRAVETVWSDTVPTTPKAFVEKARAATAKFTAAAAAAAAAKLNPCPRPDPTVTTSTATGPAKPTWSFNTVDIPTSGDGLWVYFDAGCPAGATVTGVTAPWQANPGGQASFAALVPGLVVGQPFTGAVADAAFAARPDFSGTCA